MRRPPEARALSSLRSALQDGFARLYALRAWQSQNILPKQKLKLVRVNPLRTTPEELLLERGNNLVFTREFGSCPQQLSL